MKFFPLTKNALSKPPIREGGGDAASVSHIRRGGKGEKSFLLFPMYKKGEFGKSTMRSLTYTAVPFTVVKIPVLLLLFYLLNSSLPPVLLLVPLFFFLFLDTGKNDTARTSTVQCFGKGGRMGRQHTGTTKIHRAMFPRAKKSQFTTSSRRCFRRILSNSALLGTAK